MIRFGIFRGKTTTGVCFFNKIEKPLQKQLSEGIKSVPFQEAQFLHLKIYDRPISRFFKRLLGMPDTNENLKMSGTFARVNGSANRLYDVSDTFRSGELKRLEKGENLLKDENLFVFRLAKKINQAISE